MVNQQSISEIDVKNLYLVSGRVSGDDDDTQHIVEAPSQGAAEALFIEELKQYCDGGDDAEVFIILSQPLSQAIEERLK